MKSNIFLFTATLMLLVALHVYQPTMYQAPTEEEVFVKDDVDGLKLYSLEVFKDSGFEFLRADNFNGYVKYEVAGDGDPVMLKWNLKQHLKAQGYEGAVLLMVMYKYDHERVKTWL